jgi:hypothetical protein
MPNNTIKNQKPFEVEVVVHDISELITIERKDNRDMKKIMVTLETTDGQVLFAELRNNKIDLMNKVKLAVKDKVTVSFTFQGSQKKDKKYNNIYIVTIKK